jgi:hypothetical protein
MGLKYFFNFFSPFTAMNCDVIEIPSDTPTKVDALHSAVNFLTHSQDQQISTTIITIDHTLSLFNDEDLSALNAATSKPFVVAFQSSIGGQFTVIWKCSEVFTLNVLDLVDKSNLIVLCGFVVDFLLMCLKGGHPGELKNQKKI